MKIAPANSFDLCLGPCVLEGWSLIEEVADYLVTQIAPLHTAGLPLQLYFKGSYDKANRTSIDSFRGPGLQQGLQWLAEVKTRYGLATMTDFHLPQEADEVASVVDLLQVPAFLCRQTDMIVAGAKAAQKYGRRLNIKKGQFLGPQDCEHIVAKAAHYLPREQICLTERGSSFGYNNLIVDMSSFQVMQQFGAQTIFDATHSVQMPGGQGKSSGGKRQFVRVLAQAAVAAGAQGLFIETHPRPSEALSDAATSLPLNELAGLLKGLLRIVEVVRSGATNEEN